MSDRKEGLSSGFDQAVAVAPAPFRDPDQVPMFPELEPPAAETAEASRGPGRPLGATNKRTGAIRDWLLAQGTHPLQTLMALQSAETLELAKKLKVPAKDLLSLLKLQILAAGKVAEYVEQRLPVSIDVTNRQEVTLIIGDLGDEAAAIEGLEAAGDLTIDLEVTDVKTEEHCEKS